IIEPELREILNTQLKNHKNSLQCPFLVEGSCSIYPLRPFACREYFVFGDPCKKNEDAIRTRPDSVWGPSRTVARKTSLKILPYFGFETESEKSEAFENGFVHNNSNSMHEYDWKRIAQTM
ncbi:MAG: YkgJ family cysteine cluster protein, partial [Proteobacteria bacterium]|nr:YkgJ family cysteine cluster protein [Pseudomonadota bacterium]MBU1581532.1 YkgJ family cysteine cluster protein [Pseudomonadota bacterium]MBU2455012.1 YkgJ family cysteine cluster protein [Pseudomonadota bacterium]